MLSHAAANAKNLNNQEEESKQVADKLVNLELNTEMNSEQVVA